MLFLIHDNRIIAHGITREDLVSEFRDTVYQILSSTCSVYINDEKIELPVTFPEQVDDLEFYLYRADMFVFRWKNVSEDSIIRIEDYRL